MGWSTGKASHELGCDREGFGFGGTGKKSFGKQFDTYGEVGGGVTVWCSDDVVSWW